MDGFDTHSAYEHLVQDECFTAEQAERILLVLKDSVTGELATKADIADLRTEFKADQADVRTEIEKVRTEIADVRTEIADVRTEIADVRTDLSTEIEKVRTELAQLHNKLILWGGSIVASTVVLLKALEYLFGF